MKKLPAPRAPHKIGSTLVRKGKNESPNLCHKNWLLFTCNHFTGLLDPPGQDGNLRRTRTRPPTSREPISASSPSFSPTQLLPPTVYSYHAQPKMFFKRVLRDSGKEDHQNHQKWSSTALRLLQEYSTKWASGAKTLFAVGGREANIYI